MHYRNNWFREDAETTGWKIVRTGYGEITGYPTKQSNTVAWTDIICILMWCTKKNKTSLRWNFCQLFKNDNLMKKKNQGNPSRGSSTEQLAYTREKILVTWKIK